MSVFTFKYHFEKLLWKCVFQLPDGEYFTTFNKYHCKSFYQTEHGIANATTKCKEDEKCAMISTLDCANGDSVYSLCEKSSELIPKLEACTLWKIGNEITLNSIMKWNFESS